MITHQQLVELSRNGLPGGSAVIAKAFEHPYDLILTASAQLKDWFVANGLPQQRLMHIPNAASYEVGETHMNRIAKARARRSLKREPLAVLFVGRLDIQKGIDRLTEIMGISITDNPGLRWRVVGAAIVERDEAVARLHEMITVEPAVYDEQLLTGLYEWADVLVLPSRYEGVPLTIMEAKRCGVVCIAADAGAVCETLEHGVDGFITSQEHCVAQTCTYLRKLAEDEELLRRLSSAAIEAERHVTWRRNFEPALAFIEDHLAQAPTRLMSPA